MAALPGPLQRGSCQGPCIHQDGRDPPKLLHSQQVQLHHSEARSGHLQAQLDPGHPWAQPQVWVQPLPGQVGGGATPLYLSTAALPPRTRPPVPHGNLGNPCLQSPPHSGTKKAGETSGRKSCLTPHFLPPEITLSHRSVCICVLIPEPGSRGSGSSLPCLTRRLCAGCRGRRGGTTLPADGHAQAPPEAAPTFLCLSRAPTPPSAVPLLPPAAAHSLPL